MDYTTATGYVIDSQGRRQVADRDLASNIPGTDAVARDTNGPVNEIMHVIQALGGFAGDANDDTLLCQSILKGLGALTQSVRQALQWQPVTVSQSVPVPAWAGSVEIKVVGGGGGGSSANAKTMNDGNSFCGAGGGAGGFSWGIYPVTGIQALAVAIGAGGGSQQGGGTTSASANGQLLLQATGGFGANFADRETSAGGTGGAGTGGTVLNTQGAYGGDGQDGKLFFSGYGGNGPFGGGGRAGANGGMSGCAPGAGGGGTYSPSVDQSTNGGTGADGIALIRFIP